MVYLLVLIPYCHIFWTWLTQPNTSLNRTNSFLILKSNLTQKSDVILKWFTFCLGCKGSSITGGIQKEFNHKWDTKGIQS